MACGAGVEETGVAEVFPAGVLGGGGGDWGIDEWDWEAALACEAWDASGAEEAAFFESAGGLSGGAELEGEMAESLAPVELDWPAELSDDFGGEVEGVWDGGLRGWGESAVGGAEGEAERAGDVSGVGAALEAREEAGGVGGEFGLELEPGGVQEVVELAGHGGIVRYLFGQCKSDRGWVRREG